MFINYIIIRHYDLNLWGILVFRKEEYVIELSLYKYIFCLYLFQLLSVPVEVTFNRCIFVKMNILEFLKKLYIRENI